MDRDHTKTPVVHHNKHRTLEVIFRRFITPLLLSRFLTELAMQSHSSFPSQQQTMNHHFVRPPPPRPQPVSRDEMNAVFQLCRNNQWQQVLHYVQHNPTLAVTPMTMDNHISTTLLHQTITSKGDVGLRAQVITTILQTAPQAATIKNGYGSLPLHQIAQRNTKMDAQTKERLIFQLVQAYKEALKIEGGVGKRTPLHIIFTGKYNVRMNSGECSPTSHSRVAILILSIFSFVFPQTTFLPV
jgi:hypothetical protein